jgi:hypothetical protein
MGIVDLAEQELVEWAGARETSAFGRSRIAQYWAVASRDVPLLRGRLTTALPWVAHLVMSGQLDV